ncbi:hypothetical protein TNCV_557121 [Trichonephila clavipes]|uniref:Uncharacterized protein n=1 Tax=Trichonephila clavipes TaxID=2585209 RepID=A0A8X6RQK5_TRICX|nr:hypothetical protein TNCV_557121 [Trichonephila clavipes]
MEAMDHGELYYVEIPPVNQYDIKVKRQTSHPYSGDRPYKGEKDYSDDLTDEITHFVQSIPGFQECDEDTETWMAIDAEDSAVFKC